MHKDIVLSMPSGAVSTGSSPICSNQGMYKPKKLLTIQGHPEFTPQIVQELLEARHEQGVFDDTFFTDAMSRLHDQHDGVTVGKAFLRLVFDL